MKKEVGVIKAIAVTDREGLTDQEKLHKVLEGELSMTMIITYKMTL
jgi:hypothetical protein